MGQRNNKDNRKEIWKHQSETETAKGLRLPPPSRRVTRAMTRQGTTVDPQAADDPPLCQVTRATIGQKRMPKPWKDGGVTKRRLKY